MKHHKTLRRGFSVLLSLMLCLTMLPTIALAEGTDTGKAIQLGTTQIEGSQDGSVYFGNYKQSSNGSGIFNNDPIKWRVMPNKDGKLFLLADQNLDVKPYNNSNTSITWEKSTIRSWLNGYGASENNSGMDYSSNNFIGTAFSGKEQGAIAETSVYNATQSDGRSEPNPFHLSISGGNNTTDKIFLLSIEEANKSSISLRKSTNTAYVANYSNMQAAGEADCWWLRSPGSLEDYAAFVATDGGVRYNGSEVDSTSFAVRPAFNLNLNAVLFTSAAVSGKSASGMDSGLTAVGNYTGSEWKLTLKDENRSEFTATTKTVANNKVTIEYSNAATGENEYISAILKDEDGNVNYYGRIAQLDGTTHGDSGTAEINLSGIDMTGKTLCVFNEQYNGDKKTDYASDFCMVDVTTCTISFDANGGSGSMTVVTVVPGSYTLPECGFTAPEGKHFAGWAASTDGTVITDTTIIVTANTTLYAVWEDDASVSNGKAIQLGTSQILGGQAGSVYFGNYQQSSDGSGGFNNDPIKWRVLSNADGKMFLLADQNLDVQQFYNVNTSITYEKSTIRSWLNGYGASENASGTDYSSDNFINTAFSDKEQSAISQTYVYNATKSDGTSNPNPDFELTGGNNTTDKVFLLSIEEAESSSNFPNGNSSRISTNTAYVANYSNMKAAGEANYWWLRTPGRYHNGAVDVGTDGKIYTWGGDSVYKTDIAVRPAFNLDLNAVLFTSAAEGGKRASGMDSGLTVVTDYLGSEWKLTLKDENRSEFTASAKTVGINTVTIAYSNAATGENEYISAIVKDEDNNVYYYGRIAQLDGTTNGASGTVEIDLSGIDMTDKTLCVFNEQYNGDKKTDYASNFCTVDITTYTISFDANGGSGSMTAETVVPGSYTLPECGFTEPEGQQFAGWATSANGTVITDTTITVTEDTTLYAVWSTNYGVTVNDVKVTSLNKDNVLGDDKVQYDPATRALSVKDFVAGDLTVTGDGETIVNISDNLGAPAVGTLTVTDAKDVTVTANSGAPAIYGEANISCTGNVTITNSKGMAVSAPLTVNSAQNVTIEGFSDQALAGITDITCTGNVTITNSKGMAVSAPLTVNSAKDVTVTANTSTAPAISGKADITCTGKVEITNSTGMAVDSGLTVKSAKDVTVTANSGSPAIAGAANITCTGKVDITNSTGMAVGNGLTVKSAKDVIVTANTENTGNTDYPAIGGAVDITCSGKVDITNKAGMAVSGALTVKSAKDVTITANTASPAIAGTVDITCSGDVIISNSNSDGRAVGNGLKYQRAGDHGYTVKTGPSLDELIDYEVKEAGQAFTVDFLEASAVKISVGHTSDEWQNSSTQHWQVCTVCEEEFNRADHTFSGRTCTVCGYTKPSSGGGGGVLSIYDITIAKTENGTVTVSPKSVKQGDAVTITVTPNEGYTLETLTALDKNGKEIKLTDNGSGKYTFTMPASNVTVEATFMEDNSMLNFFVDVPADAYYYNAVLWAVENGITSGVDDTHFAPDASCTRAQMVTFLWRAAGSPKADGSSPFTDVSADAYYYDAVLWAVENGITSGTSATTFAPDAAVTRDQTVTFLWRAAGSPKASGSGFSDVSSDAYYADAVAWAVQQNITSGTGNGQFSPDADCTRAQIVTFLYRYMGEE